MGTQGVLILPSGVFCNTLELPWRDNIRKRSCIPLGEYDVEIRTSPKFGQVYEVKMVPDRSYILTHSGNLAGDIEKGYLSHVEGCILLGSYWGVINKQLARLPASIVATVLPPLPPPAVLGCKILVCVLFPSR
jgi:hypothetical protein